MILWSLLTITTFMKDTHTYTHGDSMTNPAQRAESVNTIDTLNAFVYTNGLI